MPFVRPDIGVVGGVTEFLRIAAIAAAFGSRLAPHGVSGPLLTAVTAQVATSIANVETVEWIPFRR